MFPADNRKYPRARESTLFFRQAHRLVANFTSLNARGCAYTYKCISPPTFCWTAKFITRECIKWRNSNFWTPHENSPGMPAVWPAVYVKPDLGQANEGEQTRTNNLLQGTICYWNTSKLHVRVYLCSLAGLDPAWKTLSASRLSLSKKDNFVPDERKQEND